jgi:hypothetical protein
MIAVYLWQAKRFFWHVSFTAVLFFLFLLPDHRPYIVTNMYVYVYLFDVHVPVHRRHSEGKEPTRCDKVSSFIASTCFGHQYAHHQEDN